MSNELEKPPVSLCKKVCQLDAKDVCLGCGRTIDQITDWFYLSDSEKREILNRLTDSFE